MVIDNGQSRSDPGTTAPVSFTTTGTAYSNIVAARGKRRFTLLAKTDVPGGAGAADAITLEGSMTGAGDWRDMGSYMHALVDKISAAGLDDGSGVWSAVLWGIISGSAEYFVEAACPFPYVRAKVTTSGGVVNNLTLHLEAHE